MSELKSLIQQVHADYLEARPLLAEVLRRAVRILRRIDGLGAVIAGIVEREIEAAIDEDSPATPADPAVPAAGLRIVNPKS